ncbi:MAG: [protein-PII] uridylyltransferase [Deltaproteobacteria bacterium]|nr:[protein-PII] uridylyltransferase [Deltaproteobacteria bacterium]
MCPLLRQWVWPGEGRDPDDLAVMALGGYGRRELCVCSDVDLMVIHRGKLSTEAEAMISRAIYPLWDARLDVGQSILTYRECIRLAVSDFRVFTSLMDSRFLLGSLSFYRLFQDAFWSRIHREQSSLLPKFLISREQRAERYGDEGYFVEPDLKEGLGGLRDLHLMEWMARSYFKCARLDDIKRFSVFSHFELDKLTESRGVLLNVRNHLHHLTGRKEDRMLLSSQDRISRLQGYEDLPYISGPEQLMRDLYLHLNRIRYRFEEFQVKALDLIDPAPSSISPADLPPEFKVVKGNIVLKEGSVREKEPVIILKALQEANQRGLFLGSGFIWEAKKILSEQGERLKDSDEARRLFLKILLHPKTPKIIRLALEIGLIGLFIPEFRAIRNLAEFGFYHVMTVDLHSLKALDIVNEISKGDFDERWPLFRKVFEELRHPEWLFLAALLHDIGKGKGEDHARVGSESVVPILKRLRMEEGLDVVPFLVRHHLFLANMSQRRDLSDEKTSVQVAQIIQDTQILKMLFLLTVADSFATGPMARSEWKIMLLTELFMKVSRILDKGVLASPDATCQIERGKKAIIDALATDFSEADISALMDQVSPRYFLSSGIADGIRHFRMAMTMSSGNGTPHHQWVLERLKDAPVTRVIQCVYDRPGLFSEMVGVFTLNNIKILSANIFTLKNGLAFDIYEVTNPVDPYREAERWDRALKDVHSVLEDRLALDDLIREKEEARYGEPYHPPVNRSVRIDNEISDFFTVIEVRSGTGVGLTYAMAKLMFLLGLDIRFAKVNSDEERVMGVFYVRDADGQKVFEEARLATIRDEMMKVAG